ncbi:hypothetical protein GCM10023318_17280 [Nocardia callitridis]|uniref:Uncharacterized protein n=1 Tax=Nocardia callitridis TaxID=648753 RepID=A0ABP9K3Y4_9NOCA
MGRTRRTHYWEAAKTGTIRTEPERPPPTDRHIAPTSEPSARAALATATVTYRLWTSDSLRTSTTVEPSRSKITDATRADDELAP